MYIWEVKKRSSLMTNPIQVIVQWIGYVSVYIPLIFVLFRQCMQFKQNG